MKKEHNYSRNEAIQPLIEQVKAQNTKNYIKTRIIPQMEYYSRASRNCKRKYKAWKTALIVFSALVPIASIFADGSVAMKVIIAVVGSVVTAINTYLALENFRDLWYSYRTSREILLSILYRYLHNSGEFAYVESQENKDSLLIKICENEMTRESANWAEIVKAQSD